MDCIKCGKPIDKLTKFCQHCGVPIVKTTTSPKTKTAKRLSNKKVIVEPSQKLTTSTLLKWIGIALIVGLVFGWVRYWVGYYILVQGVIVGLLIPWLIGKTAQHQKEALANVRFKMSIVLFFSFMIAQAFGFGLAQPAFDPFNWFYRVLEGQTSESIFGIFSTGGVVHETFSRGLNGGFWALFSFIDLFFMWFFILVSLPLPTNKKKS